jgi:threonyl-tRNA synthetase
MSLNETERYYTLSPVNRAMMFMMLLRSYPSYQNLALIVNVGIATVHNDIN